MSEEISKSTRLYPVLILDDDIHILEAISRDLRKDALIVSFTDPHEAIESLKITNYSAIVSDLNMPAMNGLKFLEICANEAPSTPRILLTAFTDLLDIQQSINKSRVNFLLTKPWESEDLCRTVKEAIQMHVYAKENEELRRLAWTDALTGVANHRYFWERLESEFSRALRFGRSLSLIMIDVDNFKIYNDKHGHQEGDRTLRAVAQCLENSKRSMDTVARYGGEEFAIILPEVNAAQAIEIAKRHLKCVFDQSSVSISLGVAAYPENASSSTELVHKADSALLCAKGTGKFRAISFGDLDALGWKRP
jgi:diguanylate cyclase (GGDEF)-like protein